MINNNMVRDYEVSIWTLQDNFITVLKYSKIENKGKIQNSKFNIKNDGTLTFNFSLPMYLYEGSKKVENPIWYNTNNGNIIANLRKIKVIFNKNTDDEEVFEFLITKVTESHEGFELMCDVECEGLAFHELGKIGYKISLNDETYFNDWNEWYEKDGSDVTEPHCNINYWCDKVFNGLNWTYEVQMDWSAYTGIRSTNKIYEDAYVAAWGGTSDQLTPTTFVEAREKERLIEAEESNIYNITQTIAETFGVYCKYVYEHDENYHITARKAIFYNNFLKEEEGAIDINYSYDSSSISREMDSTDVVTKMYVKTLEDSNTESGLATIMDTEANKSQEDYLLNFDYLYSIGSITEEQYAEIPNYELQLHNLNEELKMYENQLINLQDQLIDASSQATLAKNAVGLDTERISATNELLNSITNGTSTVTVDNSRPDYCAVIESDGKYYINLRQKGIIAKTIKIYSTYSTQDSTLSGKITAYTLIYDEFGNVIKAQFNGTPNANVVYVIYDYRPELYYDNIRKVWESRLFKDTNTYNTQSKLVNTLETAINSIKSDKESALKQKEQIIKHFERLMGPAIREGYWQPDDIYAKYGEKHLDVLSLNTDSPASQFNSDLASIGWDDELFEGEQDITYEVGAQQQINYYPYVDLTNYMSTLMQYHDNFSQLSFIFKTNPDPNSSNDDLKNLQFFPFGSQAQLMFAKIQGSIKSILLLTGAESLAQDSLLQVNPRIGILRTEPQNGNIISNVEEVIPLESNQVITSYNGNEKAVYPRIRIDSSSLKVSEDELVIKHGQSGTLKNYEDYYVLGRKDSLSNNRYAYRNYITIKPEYIFTRGTTSINFDCAYTISNAGLFMYLDAIQVLKENAYPRVSYSITPEIVNPTFTKFAYRNLNKIVHINDYELKFENVQGYITELQLDLDEPWNDEITVENYKTKFEDLFSSIVAQTEEMKKNSSLIGMAARAFTTTGDFKTNMIQSVMNRVDLNYAFNNGTLTIDEDEGIWGTSDSGVVAFRGGGIFTATKKDNGGNWIWNTGILPSGINASLITTGQLDTNLIRIFAGDDLKFQMNGDGLYAYRSWWDDPSVTAGGNRQQNGLDLGQYVVHNSEGLFLVAKAGTILNRTILQNDVERVSISWDGLKIRNNSNELVFYADENGNLKVTGTIYATNLYVGNTTTTIENYIGQNSAKTYYSTTTPGNPRIGDLWFNPSDNIQYIYTEAPQPWTPYNKKINGTNFSVDSENGTINILATKKMDLITNGKLTILGGAGVSIGSSTSVSIVSASDSTSNVLTLNSNGITMYSGGNISMTGGNIQLKSGNNTNVTLDNNGISMNTSGSASTQTVEITKDKFDVATPKFSVNINNSGEHFLLDETGGYMEHLAVNKTLWAPNMVQIYTGPTTLNIGTGQVYSSLAEFAATVNNRILTSNVYVNLTDSTVYGSAELKGVSGSGSITFNFNNHNVYGEITLTNVNVPTQFYNGGIQGRMRVNGGGLCRIWGITFNSNEGIAVRVRNGARLYIHDCTFYNAWTCIQSDIDTLTPTAGSGPLATCNIISAQYLKGDMPAYSINGEYSVFMWGGTRPRGTVSLSQCVTNPELLDQNQVVPTSADGQTPTPPAMPTTVSYTASASGTCNGTSSWVGDNYVRQGYDGYERRGCMWFSGASAVRSKTIRNATLTVTREAGYGGSSEISLTLYTTPLTGKSGTPALSNGTSLGTIANGETKTFAIPTNMANLAANGYGLVLYTGETAVASGKKYSRHYGRVYGAGMSGAPVLTVTYTS